jgi:hypothetical protein
VYLLISWGLVYLGSKQVQVPRYPGTQVARYPVLRYTGKV